MLTNENVELFSAMSKTLNYSFLTVHPGFCPPLPIKCSSKPEENQKTCIDDSSCEVKEKCCFDTCQTNSDHHFICKIATAVKLL